jgi:hypothetical protein
MMLRVGARRRLIGFAALVGALAGLVTNSFPERADLAVGLAFLLIIVVMLAVSRPRPQ